MDAVELLYEHGRNLIRHKQNRIPAWARANYP